MNLGGPRQMGKREGFSALQRVSTSLCPAPGSALPGRIRNQASRDCSLWVDWRASVVLNQNPSGSAEPPSQAPPSVQPGLPATFQQDTLEASPRPGQSCWQVALQDPEVGSAGALSERWRGRPWHSCPEQCLRALATIARGSTVLPCLSQPLGIYMCTLGE